MSARTDDPWDDVPLDQRRNYINPPVTEECELCGDDGDIWFDVEMPSGKVLEDSRPCPRGCRPDMTTGAEL